MARHVRRALLIRTTRTAAKVAAAQCTARSLGSKLTFGVHESARRAHLQPQCAHLDTLAKRSQLARSQPGIPQRANKALHDASPTVKTQSLQPSCARPAGRCIPCVTAHNAKQNVISSAEELARHLREARHAPVSLLAVHVRSTGSPRTPFPQRPPRSRAHVFAALEDVALPGVLLDVGALTLRRHARRIELVLAHAARARVAAARQTWRSGVRQARLRTRAACRRHGGAQGVCRRTEIEEQRTHR